MLPPMNTPKRRRHAKALCLLRALYDAEPGKEKKAMKKALKRFKAAHPKKAFRAQAAA